MAVQILCKAVAAADARQDEVEGSLLRWTLCYFLLLGGRKPNFTVQNFLNLVQEVRLHMLPAGLWSLSLFETVAPPCCRHMCNSFAYQWHEGEHLPLHAGKPAPAQGQVLGLGR